jgi:hypothetical protein
VVGGGGSAAGEAGARQPLLCRHWSARQAATAKSAFLQSDTIRHVEEPWSNTEIMVQLEDDALALEAEMAHWYVFALRPRFDVFAANKNQASTLKATHSGNSRTPCMPAECGAS